MEGELELGQYKKREKTREMGGRRLSWVSPSLPFFPFFSPFELKKGRKTDLLR